MVKVPRPTSNLDDLLIDTPDAVRLYHDYGSGRWWLVTRHGGRYEGVVLYAPPKDTPFTYVEAGRMCRSPAMRRVAAIGVDDQERLRTIWKAAERRGGGD